MQNCPIMKKSSLGCSEVCNNKLDDTFFLGLALRGYDLSRLRENDETQTPAGEIVKIG